MKIQKIELSKLKKNPENPRLIKDEKFKKLVQSLKDFPEMMQLRPIVVNKESDYNSVSGIYFIFSKIDERIYIGSTVSIGRRFMEHKNALRSNTHHSKYLQRFYNKYGESSIGFALICVAGNVERIIAVEQLFLDILKPEFNVCQQANSRLGCISSKETRERISKSRLALNIKYDDEYKRRMSEKLSGENNPMFGTKGALSPNWGKQHKPETIEKMIKSHRDVKGENNPKYGIPQTPEATALAMESKRNRSLEKGKGVKAIKDGIISVFRSTGEASEALGLCRTNILRCCKGIYRQCRGYQFKFIGINNV